MKVLRALTLGYVAVLVSTVGTSLTAIWLFLRRIAGALDEAREALATARDETVPLNERLQGLHGAVAGSAADLAETRTRLARANDHLAMLAGQSGAAKLTE